MKRPVPRQTRLSSRLLVGTGSGLAMAATLLLAPTASAATATATDTAAAAAAADPGQVPTDQGGLYRSTLEPMVPPGCAMVAVDLPLVEGVTWWVQRLDTIEVAQVPQPLDPTGSTTLHAVLSPGYVFEDGATSARWLVAPQDADISTGCSDEPAEPVVVEPAEPVVVEPVGVAPVAPVVVVQPEVAPDAAAVPPAAAHRTRLLSRARHQVAVAPAATPAVTPAVVTPDPTTTERAAALVPAAEARSSTVTSTVGSTRGRAAVDRAADRARDRVVVSAVSSPAPSASSASASSASAYLAAGLVLAVLASAAVTTALRGLRSPSEAAPRR